MTNTPGPGHHLLAQLPGQHTLDVPCLLTGQQGEPPKEGAMRCLRVCSSPAPLKQVSCEVIDLRTKYSSKGLGFIIRQHQLRLEPGSQVFILCPAHYSLENRQDDTAALLAMFLCMLKADSDMPM